MNDYETMLSIQALRTLLTNDLGQISDKTGISLSTLKNYRYGTSSLDSMPYKLVKQLSDYAKDQIDPLAIPNHYLVNNSTFKELTDKFRPHSTDMLELLNAKLIFNWQQSTIFTTNKPNKSNRYYFFIQNLDALKKNKYIDVETILSIGLALNINFFICYENDSDLNFGRMLSTNEIEHILNLPTTDLGTTIDTQQLNELTTTINNKTSLLTENIPYYLMRDLIPKEREDQYEQSIWETIILEFIDIYPTEKWTSLLTAKQNQQSQIIYDFLQTTSQFKTITNSNTTTILNLITGLIVTIITTNNQLITQIKRYAN